MTGKTKKEIQNENIALRKELNEIKSKYEQLSEKTASNVKCNNCEKTSVTAGDVSKPQDYRNSVIQTKCDHCGKVFNEQWKMTAHLKTCKQNQCEMCDKTFKYEELKKKHMLITHENFRIYCHFYNNEKTCPYDKECVFLHEESQICKYGTLCERTYCMFKHGKKKESDVSVSNENEMDVNNDEEFVNIVDEVADISNKTPRTIVVEINEEKIVTVESVDETISVEDVDETLISKEMIETVEDSEPVKKKKYEDSSSRFFKCKMCDFAAARKISLRDHKKTSHNWCFICFSTFTSQDDLKDHFYKEHSKNEGDLVLVLGKAPR